MDYASIAKRCPLTERWLRGSKRGRPFSRHFDLSNALFRLLQVLDGTPGLHAGKFKRLNVEEHESRYRGHETNEDAVDGYPGEYQMAEGDGRQPDRDAYAPAL